MTMDQVAARLEKLERSNRRWRAGAVALGLGLAAALAIGAAAPEKVPDVLKAHELQITNGDGQVVAKLYNHSGGTLEVSAPDVLTTPLVVPTPLHLAAQLGPGADGGAELMLISQGNRPGGNVSMAYISTSELGSSVAVSSGTDAESRSVSLRSERPDRKSPVTARVNIYRTAKGQGSTVWSAP